MFPYIKNEGGYKAMYVNGNNALSMEVTETVRVYSKEDINRIKAETIKTYKRRKRKEHIETIKLTIVLFGGILFPALMVLYWVGFGY